MWVAAYKHLVKPMPKGAPEPRSLRPSRTRGNQELLEVLDAMAIVADAQNAAVGVVVDDDVCCAPARRAFCKSSVTSVKRSVKAKRWLRRAPSSLKRTSIFMEISLKMAATLDGMARAGGGVRRGRRCRFGTDAVNN